MLTVEERAFLEAMAVKHLPGRHDQSSHGRRGMRSARRAGRDRLTEIAGAASAYFGPLGGARAEWDDRLGRIVARQGFDGKPRVVDERTMDRAIQSGWTEVWRGVKRGRSVEPSEVNQRLRFGPFEPGRGNYGNGLYLSERRETAEQYAESFNAGVLPDSVVRIAIDPNARIADFDELLEDARDWHRGRSQLSDDERIQPENIDAQATILMEDLGRYAAARGYDAIRIIGHSDGAMYPEGEPPAPQYAILNRTALMIQERDGNAD